LSSTTQAGSGRRTVSLTVFAVTTVILVIVSGVLGFYVYTLTGRIAGLEAEVSDLSDQYNSLKAQYDKLLADYSSLQNEHAQLLNKYNSLEAAYSESQAIIGLKKSTVLAKDKPVQLPANSYRYFEYDLQYAGYLQITFSATGNVYFYVGNGDYWVRYPSDYSKTAASGSFIVPVLPGATYVYIYNPSLFSGVSVTVSIEYVY